MKALLRKEYYVIRKTFRSYFAAIAVFGVAGAFKPGLLFLVIYPLVLSAMLPYSLYSLDENGGWNALSRTLPYTENHIVGAKYIVSVAVVVLTWLYIALLQLLVGAAGVREAVPLLGLLCTALLMPAVFLPTAIRFGTRKMFYLYHGILMGFFGIIMGIVSSYKKAGAMESILRLPLGLMITAAVVCLPIVLFLSYRLSVRFYREREF